MLNIFMLYDLLQIRLDRIDNLFFLLQFLLPALFYCSEFTVRFFVAMSELSFKMCSTRARYITFHCIVENVHMPDNNSQQSLVRNV